MDKIFNGEESMLLPNEEKLLERVKGNERLRPFFFRKAKGLKWFDALEKEGYFKPSKGLKPVPSDEKGYVRIPDWPVADYLVSTAPELADKDNQEYAEKFIQILVDVTDYAKKNKFSNCHVWLAFAEIISQIPCELISSKHINIVDYWLDDEHGRSGVIAKILGERWLPILLQSNNAKALRLAKKVIEFLYKVKFQKSSYGGEYKQTGYIRVEYFWAEEITKNIAKLAGEKLGLKAVAIFDKSLTKILKKLENDSWSLFWQPAIEDHEQNKRKDKAENILIYAYRDSLDGYIHAKREEEEKKVLAHVGSMLESPYQTIRRLAIYVITKYVITKNGCLSEGIIDQLLNEEYLSSNYRHEMWHFLNKHYLNFCDSQKRELLNLISSREGHDREGKPHKGASDRIKSIWLSAIKEYGDEEKKAYAESTKIIKTEPEHPDFANYVKVERVIHKSPKSLEELQKLSIDELVRFLESYKASGRLDELGLDGLAEVFQQVIKIQPLKFYLHLDKFTKLNMAYIYEIIEAYRELLVEKIELPWDEIWQKLFEFCDAVINQGEFWGDENLKSSGLFVANRHWVVSSIGQLIEAGVKAGKHSFSEDTSLKDAENILACLLKQQEGELYEEHSDAVFISINSPRGHCLRALINLTLYSFGIANKDIDKNSSDVWSHFQDYYDSELEREDSGKPKYEFATLVTMYLHNFMYMSEKWVLENCDKNKIFDQTNYLKWLCAMKGYAYVGVVNKGIYEHLKEHGDLLKALDDENIGSYGVDWAVQNIAIAYIEDFESFEQKGNLITKLITKKDYEIMNYLIRFIWNYQGSYKEKNKVYKLWSKILKSINLLTKDGKEIPLLIEEDKEISLLSEDGKEILLLSEDRKGMPSLIEVGKKIPSLTKNKKKIALTKDKKKINLLTKNEKKIASCLCHWIEFIDKVDSDESLELLLAIAPYSDEEHNSHYLLECLAKISDTKLLKACEIWLEILTKGPTAPDHPEEAIKKLLLNLTLFEKDGKESQKAKEIVSQYIAKGNKRPADWLNEIKENLKLKK